MAETRETYVAGEGDATPPRTGSSMRDMDRMLDDTLASAEPDDRTPRVRSDDDVEDIDINYADRGTGGDVSGEDTGESDTDDPDAVRSEIQQTRARMSETIDEIEDALLRKKEDIQDRLNVFTPVQNNPLPSVGIAFGAGLILGYLTGEDDDEDDDFPRHSPTHADDDEFWSRRASDWEARARRLLDLAKRQEVELSELRGRSHTAGHTSGIGSSMGASAGAGAAAATGSYSGGAGIGSSTGDSYEVTFEDEDEGGWGRLASPIRSIGDTVVEGLTSFLARATRELSGTQQR